MNINEKGQLCEGLNQAPTDRCVRFNPSNEEIVDCLICIESVLGILESGGSSKHDIPNLKQAISILGKYVWLLRGLGR